MKRIILLVALVAMTAVPMPGQQKNPWKFVDMEDVSRHGGNAVYDDETCTVEFKGSSDRWIDLPGLNGDLNGHTDLVMKVKRSDCVLKIALRYKDADGKTNQVTVATLYGQTGKPVVKEKALKIDLTNKGEITREMLANVVSVRLAMAKPSVEKDAPWAVEFGEVILY